MLGNSIFSSLLKSKNLDVYGTIRGKLKNNKYFSTNTEKIFQDNDASNIDSIESTIKKLRPEVVINCIGIIKQQKLSREYIETIRINSLFPHEIAHICNKVNSKLIHFSTDCVFSGSKGSYKENDIPDACDLYGRSKHMGEIEYDNHITLRTSIIGHEIGSSLSLIDWFLSQSGEVNGYTKAIFSGLPTCIIADILEKHILCNTNLKGLYHLSVEPIDKYSLLRLVANIYNKEIIIKKSDDLVINRSLNSERLQKSINFKPPSWNTLIQAMHLDYQTRFRD